jgi:hypothetical protein
MLDRHMAMTKTHRWIALLVLGGTTGAAALALYEQERRAPESSGQAAQAKPGSSSPRAAAVGSGAGIPGAPRRERQSGEVLGTPFGALEQVARAAPRAVELPAPPPPPFPYRYGGQMLAGDGNAHLYLAKDNELIAVHLGDVLEGGFKVVAISADSLDAIHLPSGKTVQILYSSLGAAPEPAPAASGSKSESDPDDRQRAALGRAR